MSEQAPEVQGGSSRRWAAGTALIVLLAVVTVLYGGPTLELQVAALWIGVLAGVRLGGGPGVIPALEPPRWRVVAPLIVLATILVLGTSSLPLLIGLAAGLVLGLFLGAILAWRSSRASAPYAPVDLVAPLVALAIFLASAVLTDAGAGSCLLLAALALWVLGVLWIPIRFVVRLVWPSVLAAPNAAHVYRWFLVSAACAIAAFVIGSHELSHVDGRLRARVDAIASRDHGVPTATAAALGNLEGLHDSLLLRAYAPRLFLPTGQAAWPHHPWVDVLESEVVNPATGAHSRTRWAPPDEPSVPDDCRYPKGSGCYITDHCFTAGQSCGEVAGTLDWPYGIYIPPGGNDRDGFLYPYGVVYGRMVRRDGESIGDLPDVARRVFANAAKAEEHFGGKRITDLLQYWMYYRYDDWRADTALGQVVQEHESDWEAVTVGLADDAPMFVAYSAHCGGQWLPWDDVPAVRNHKRERGILEGLAGRYPDQADAVGRVIEALDREPTHPAVMVAKGSQGNYPATTDIKVPDWTSCPLGTTAGDVLAAAAAVREDVDVSVEVVPVDIYLALVDELPMDFGGHWGLNSRQRLILPIGDAEIGLGGSEDTPGPPAPPTQGVWTDPFGTIFDSGDWHEGAGV